MTPTARTLAYLRALGFQAAVVERFNSFTKRRTDLFHCIDVLAIHPVQGIIGIQCCAAASHSDRRKKALAEPRLEDWLRASGRFQVISWRKGGPRGKRKTWSARVEEVNLQDVTGKP